MGNDHSVSTSSKVSVSSMPSMSVNETSDVSSRHLPRRSFDQRKSQLQQLHEVVVSRESPSPQRKHSGCQPRRDSSQQSDRPSTQHRRLSNTPKHSICSLSFNSTLTPTSSSSLSAEVPTRGRASSTVIHRVPDPQFSDWRDEKRSPLLAFCNHYQQFQQQQREQPSRTVYRRRMSVDEAQQTSTRAGGANEGGGVSSMAKLSLAGLPPTAPQFGSSTSVSASISSNQPNGMVEISRARVSKGTRELTESGEFGLSLQEHLKLTNYQTLMLTQTWPRVRPSVFGGVFKELCQKCPKVKELFQKSSIVGSFSATKCFDIDKHIKLVTELLDLCLQDMNAPVKTSQDRCVAIGETHFSIVGPGAANIWDDLGVCLTEAISKADAIRGKREAFKAFIGLISFLIDSMKAGFMAQAKRKSLTRASNGHVPGFGR